jgi:FKBP-type peptidyl-prolyl cis-trans isomerase FklB
MRNLVIAALVVVAAGTAALRAEDEPKPGPALDTLEKKVGYALGHRLGTDLKNQGGSIDADAVARGIRDGLSGTAPVLSDQAMQAAIMEYQRVLQAKAMEQHSEKGKKNKVEGAAFLEKNKSAEGVSTTKSGLQYKCLQKGTSERKPVASDTVKVNYEGKLIDGTVFDSSYKRGMPAEFGLTQVIPGWTEGLQLMEVGSTYELYIPGELAYGENPPPGVIGPNSVLIFKVELLEIKQAK